MAVMGFKMLGAFTQLGAARTQAENQRKIAKYNSEVQLNQGLQQQLNYKTQAKSLENQRTGQIFAEGMNEQTATREFQKQSESARASIAGRGGDASDITSSIAIQKERTLQQMGFQSGQIEANTDYQATLSDFYGSLAAREGRQKSAVTLAEGKAQADATEQAAGAKFIGDMASAVIGGIANTPSTPSPVSIPQASTYDPNMVASSFFYGNGSTGFDQQLNNSLSGSFLGGTTKSSW